MLFFWGREKSPEERDKETRESSHGRFPTVESWGDRDAKLEVSQREGFACKACTLTVCGAVWSKRRGIVQADCVPDSKQVAMKARIELSPADLYHMLTEEDNTRYFRNLKV